MLLAQRGHGHAARVQGNMRKHTEPMLSSPIVLQNNWVAYGKFLRPPVPEAYPAPPVALSAEAAHEVPPGEGTKTPCKLVRSGKVLVCLKG
jgi:hypothetical protein